ncbi:2-oxoacid:acceptor oxidoreductase family protein [Candidatus Bipolaricaulota bacterium]|jgi:2-oxoglutarate ferredoxin oxidoreductase subunit gamma|nr:2-oxoacid:acceptor oxidoreductase family protein [Candidatus Bipolaricaulota bacterium]
MQQSVIIAGFGGQGVILAGKILAQAAMDHGLEVTWLPSYGPEMRGGTANCTVVMADETVGSPIVDDPSAVIAMNLPSLDKFEGIVAQGGRIILNASLIDRDVERSDLKVTKLLLNDLSAKAGSSKAINMVALGAYVKATGVIPIDVVKETMREMLEKGGKGRFVEANAKALDLGYDAA